MSRLWKRLKSEILFETRIFRLRRDTSESPRTGKAHPFHVLEATDWVNVIPVTGDGQIVLIEQFRHGLSEMQLEIPGGMVDPEDRSPMEAAGRELREETGYEADELVHIGTVHPNPAILDNVCTTFLALGARCTGEPEPDSTEEIFVKTVPAEEIPGMIDGGAISNALIVAAFYWYDRYLQARGNPPLGVGRSPRSHEM